MSKDPNFQKKRTSRGKIALCKPHPPPSLELWRVPRPNIRLNRVIVLYGSGSPISALIPHRS